MTTKLQIEMIKKIAESEYNMVNGGKLSCAADSETWADTIIENAQDRGVARSLVNAGMIYHVGSARDAGIGLTEAGFAFYQMLQAQ